MSYYFAKTLNMPFDAAIQTVTQALQANGFGIVTEIDMQATFKKKINQDIQPYRILGACNANYAFEALKLENKIGTMLPCNVIVQEIAPNTVEVAAIDPVASMSAIPNTELKTMAAQVGTALRTMIESLE